MYLPSAVTKQAEIESAVARVQQSIGPDVVRIRYEIGEDWNGQWAIFFRILLTDDAARHRLRDVATSVVWGLAQHMDYPGAGRAPKRPPDDENGGAIIQRDSPRRNQSV